MLAPELVTVLPPKKIAALPAFCRIATCPGVTVSATAAVVVTVTEPFAKLKLAIKANRNGDRTPGNRGRDNRLDKPSEGASAGNCRSGGRRSRRNGRADIKPRSGSTG